MFFWPKDPSMEHSRFPNSALIPNLVLCQLTSSCQNLYDALMFCLCPKNKCGYIIILPSKSTFWS